LRPELAIGVVSAAPEWLFRRALGDALVFRGLACDVGLAQRGALEIDEPGTVRAWKAFAGAWGARVAAEATWLREVRATLVLADVPPLAFDAAAHVGVPAVGLANFSWDWIYRHYAARQPELLAAAERCARAYAQARLLLRLPFAGDLSSFPKIEDVGLVARQPRVARDEARRRLGWDGRPTALVSFGGLGLPGFDAGVLAVLQAYRFVLPVVWGALPSNVEVVDTARLEAGQLEYVDLVGACDVVVTKPGYGIVSDCIGAGTRLLYTERGDFPEYEILVAQMESCVACEPLERASLFAGCWGEGLERVLARALPPRPDLGGAERAARHLVELC
jgi:L-arabinokinase